MKIAIEAQRIFRTNKHGMDFVALELICALQKIDFVNEYYIFVASGEDNCLQSKDNFQVVELSSSNYLIWEQILFPRALKKLQPDVVHCTSNTAPLFCPFPLIVTLHDIIFLEKKLGENTSFYQKLGRVYRRFVVPKVVKEAKKIITVSNYEKGVIEAGLCTAKGKVSTVYNGVGSEFQPIEDYKSITKKYLSEEKYLFLLGNTDPKKNFVRTLTAYAMYVRHSRCPHSLLIADLDRDYLEEILCKEKIFDIKNYIILSGYIPHQDLPAIYNGAYAFLYPSLRESFGLPLLEAMACGTPVITSNTSALPEVGGEGAILATPTYVKEIADMILKLEKCKDFYNKQVTYGLLRAKQFSWQNTAQQTLNLYNNI